MLVQAENATRRKLSGRFPLYHAERRLADRTRTAVMYCVDNCFPHLFRKYAWYGFHKTSLPCSNDSASSGLVGLIRYLRVSISPYATSKLVPHFQVIYTRYPIPYAVGAIAKRLTSTNSCQGPAANVLYDTSTALEQHTLFGYFAIDTHSAHCRTANAITPTL